eukprot:1143555-Pelagomonas_calceolata.AAC.1
MAESSEHAAGPLMASAFRVRQFVRENFLANRPYVPLRLGKTYVVPAGTYAGQVWATEYIKGGKKLASDLQVRHTLRRVLKADLNILSREPSCWTAQVLDAFQGLWRCDSFVQAVRQGTPIPIQEFTDDLRHRLQAVWRDVERVNPRDTYSKLATYQSLFAVPFDHNVRAPPVYRRLQKVTEKRRPPVKTVDC